MSHSNGMKLVETLLHYASIKDLKTCHYSMTHYKYPSCYLGINTYSENCRLSSEIFIDSFIPIRFRRLERAVAHNKYVQYV